MPKKKIETEEIVNLTPGDEESYEPNTEGSSEPQGEETPSEETPSEELDGQPTVTYVAINNFSGEMGSFSIGDVIPENIAELYGEGWEKAGIVKIKE